MDASQHEAVTGGEAAQRAPLYVPVRQGPAGHVVRLWRTPFGSRTAVAFTSDRQLRSVLGPTQPWIRLSESALRAMAEPLGAAHLTVDPLLTARAPATWPQPQPGVQPQVDTVAAKPQARTAAVAAKPQVRTKAKGRKQQSAGTTP